MVRGGDGRNLPPRTNFNKMMINLLFSITYAECTLQALAKEVNMANCDWAIENTKGRGEADALIERMKLEGSPLALIRRLDPEAQASGVEIGFLNRLAEHLIATA